jgi:hypothetical protein
MFMRRKNPSYIYPSLRTCKHHLYPSSIPTNKSLELSFPGSSNLPIYFQVAHEVAGASNLWEGGDHTGVDAEGERLMQWSLTLARAMGKHDVIEKDSFGKMGPGAESEVCSLNYD